MLDPASCREWADRVKADPSGFTAHKFGFSHTDPRIDPARDRSNRVLTTTELARIRRGFENCRWAIGWDHDIIVHTIATPHWASTIRDFLASETVVGRGDWMDQIVIHDGPVIKKGCIAPSDRPGLGLELNPEVVRAHLAPGESYWDFAHRV